MEMSMTTSRTGLLIICLSTCLLEYDLFSAETLSFVSLIPNITINADRKIVRDVHLNVDAYPNISASDPPSKGPISVPVMLPVCNVPRTRPAIFLGVCMEIRACDIGINPVKIPIIIRNKKRCQTDVANPISRTDIAVPVAEMIKIFFRPYLSPIRPQMGEKKKAATKVTAKIQPDQLCT